METHIGAREKPTHWYVCSSTLGFFAVSCASLAADDIGRSTATLFFLRGGSSSEDDSARSVRLVAGAGRGAPTAVAFETVLLRRRKWSAVALSARTRTSCAERACWRNLQKWRKRVGQAGHLQDGAWGVRCANTTKTTH